MSGRESSINPKHSKRKSFGKGAKSSGPLKSADAAPQLEQDQANVQKTTAFPKKAEPQDILSLHQVLGNKQVAHILGPHAPNVQRHTINNAPPQPGEEEVQRQEHIQRHTVNNAPPLPDEEEVQTKRVVQRKRDGKQPAFGKFAPGGTAPAITPVDRDGIWRWKKGEASKGEAAKGKAPVGVKEAGGAKEKSVKIGADRVVYRGIKLDVNEVPADGKSLVQPTVKTSPDKRPVQWSLIGKSYGSKIDPKTGQITVGSDTQKSDFRYLMVMAQDEEVPKAYSFAWVTLYDAKYFQAKKDYPEFIKAGPYEWKNFRPYNFGKFDVEYNPSAKRLLIDMKIKFSFPNNGPVPGETADQKKAREQKEIDYAKYFKDRIHAGWSGKFSFKNIREPQSIWGKLNPIAVKVNLTEVKSNPHWEIKKYFGQEGQTSFANASGFAKMYEDKSVAYVQGTRSGEMNRLRRILPRTIFFRNAKSKVGRSYQTSLGFVADYLKQINQPKFKLTMTGYATRGETKKDGTLPNTRAEAVKSVLTGAGLNNHTLITATGGARRRYVRIKHELQNPNYKNVQDTTLHEFGHMLGLDDEYDARSGDSTRQAGWKVEHYDLVYAALGRKYGKEVSKVYRGDSQGGKAMDSASVMFSGSDLRVQHYVTLWDALVQSVNKSAPVPDTKFGQADFKFNM